MPSSVWGTFTVVAVVAMVAMIWMLLSVKRFSDAVVLFVFMACAVLAIIGMLISVAGLSR